MIKNNDFKIRILLVSLAFCMVFALTLSLDFSARVNADSAAGAAAGSADDPLITLSYLNSVLPAAADTAGTYVILELARGQRLRSRSNSVEIILRPDGAAAVISQHADYGVIDLTSGLERLSGEELPVNHLILVPRADGRGISVTSSKAFVMVRGDYEIY